MAKSEQAICATHIRCPEYYIQTLSIVLSYIHYEYSTTWTVEISLATTNSRQMGFCEYKETEAP